ncbi:MAG: glycosyltransferase family 39 protein [Nanoarchaeota archaeon]
MGRSWKSIWLFLSVWLVTRIAFFYWFGSRLIFDEASYLYEIKSLSENSIHVFSQGPVLYYWVLPFFKLAHSILISKLPILLADLVFLGVIYFALKKHDEKIASCTALLYALAPISLFVSYHLTTEVLALMFTFLSIFFFVRFHAYRSVKDLIGAGIFLLLGGLTKEMDFFLYLFFPIYLILWHWKVEKVHKKVVYALVGLIVITFIVKVGILTGLSWGKNPTRLSSMFFLPFKNGGFLNGGVLYFVMVFFLFVNPITAILGYPKVYSFLKSLFKKKVKVKRGDLLLRLRFISATVVAFLVLFFTYFGANEARYVYFVVPFVALLAAQRFSSLSMKWKVGLVILALASQVWLVVEYEKDSEGFDVLGVYLDALPTDTIYTDNPHRSSEHFVPSILSFKTSKKVVYLDEADLVSLAKKQPIYLLAYHRSGLKSVDDLLSENRIEFDRVTFVVGDYNRYIYVVGAKLPRMEKIAYQTFFTQPLRTPPEEWLFQYLIYAKRDFCSVPKEMRGWFRAHVCSWGE